MVRTCDQCGHNPTTCDETNSNRNNGAKVLLFGVDLMQKQNNTNSSSSNNASAVNTDASSFVNDGISRPKHESKGIPWTEEEHLAFLAGLKEVGRGEWKKISMEFVKTRTSTQVASHAQKYFLRSLNQKKKKRRSSIFDTPLDNHNSVIVQHNPLTDWCTTTASKPKAQEFNQIIPNLGLGLGYSSSVNPVFPNHGRIPYMGGVIGRTRPAGYVQVMNYGRLGYAYIPNFYNNAHAPLYPPQTLSMVSQQADGHGSSTLVAKDVTVELKLGPSSECSISQPSGPIRVT